MINQNHVKVGFFMTAAVVMANSGLTHLLSHEYWYSSFSFVSTFVWVLSAHDIVRPDQRD